MQNSALPAVLEPLFAPMRYAKGVGPARETMLARLNIMRRRDALFHLPTSYVQRRTLPDLFSAKAGEDAILAVEVEQILKPRRRGLPTTVQCVDNAKVPIELVYFSAKGDWLEKLFPINARRWVIGKLEMGARWQMVHPEHVSPTPPDALAIEPVYPLTAGLPNGSVLKLVREVLQSAPALPEWHDTALLAQRGWPSWRAALEAVHIPKDAEAAAGAETSRDRLAYDEILAQQLALTLVRRNQKKQAGVAMPPHTLRAKAIAALPFALTAGQEAALAEIDADMAQPERMRRLLQGDVGSGKTIMAWLAMLNAVDAGRQAAIVAPTEILARQHAETIGKYADALGIKCITLTGRDTGRDREGILRQIADGTARVIIGTHSLFQDAAAFKDLGFVVIDEQHKFGVHQRLKLTQKSRGMDMLVMTATPIPRTLALTLYGDMDVSRLEGKPPGRKPCDTRLVSLSKLDEVVAGISRKIAAGEQIFWICPLVEKHEVLQLSDAETRAEHLEGYFPGQVALVHGQMSKKQLDIAMNRFVRGDAKILVATTVVEVGVNIPAATVMVIEHAERFGLAQLHQLRGRIGRGSAAATCLLLYGGLNETARARLEIMRETEDGFRIAEEDLKLRGAGEFLGTRQSGDPAFRLATLAQASEMLDMARRDAELFLSRDAEFTSPRGQALRTLLYLMDRHEGVKLFRG